MEKILEKIYRFIFCSTANLKQFIGYKRSHDLYWRQMRLLSILQQIYRFHRFQSMQDFKFAVERKITQTKSFSIVGYNKKFSLIYFLFENKFKTFHWLKTVTWPRPFFSNEMS